MHPHQTGDLYTFTPFSTVPFSGDTRRHIRDVRGTGQTLRPQTLQRAAAIRSIVSCRGFATTAPSCLQLTCLPHFAFLQGILGPGDKGGRGLGAAWGGASLPQAAFRWLLPAALRVVVAGNEERGCVGGPGGRRPVMLKSGSGDGKRLCENSTRQKLMEKSASWLAETLLHFL